MLDISQGTKQKMHKSFLHNYALVRFLFIFLLLFH